MKSENQNKDDKELTGREQVFEKLGVVVPRGNLENKIFDVKVDTWEILQFLKNKIKEIQKEINVKWFQMAKYLYIIWRDEAWKLEGCESWSEWVAQNYEYLGRGLRQVERLIRVWKVLVIDLKQPIEKVAELPSTNAYEITRYAKKSNVEDLVNMGIGLETRALRKTLEQANLENLSDAQIFHCDHDEVIVLYKCKKCKEVFYRIPEKTKFVVDKQGNLDPKKVKAKILNESSFYSEPAS